MKIAFIFLAVLYSSICLTFGQTQDWQWAVSSGNSGHDFAFGNSTDNNGNTIAVGCFQSSTITFGSHILTNPTPQFPNCIFVVKYDSLGNVIWAKGGQSGIAYASSVDAIGNIYVTGSYSGTVSFGSYTFTNNFGFDAFLVKYDASGNVVWAKSLEGSGLYQHGMAVANDSFGNTFITGDFSCDSLQADGLLIINPNYGCFGDIFIAKYDSLGNILWLKRAGGYGKDEAKGICVDETGNAYITGHVHGNGVVDFDTLPIALPSSYNRVFVAKYSPSGNALWVKFAGSTYLDESNAISIDSDNGIYITGTFGGNTISFGSTVLNNFGYRDLFLAKYDHNGNVLWAKNGGGINEDRGTGICTDIEKNIYVLAYSQSPTFTFGNSNLAANRGLLVAKFDYLGNLAETHSAIANGFCQQVVSSTISVDPTQNLYITGHYASDTVMFSNNICFNNTACYEDVFVAKIGKNLATNGIENESLERSTIYPNPFTDWVTVDVPNKTRIEISNIEGKIINRFVVVDSPAQIDFSDFGSGVYFFRTITHNGISIQKIVKH